MARQIHVDLVSVEESVWSGEADLVVARTTEGELGVLPGHAPLLGQLAEPSEVRVKKPDGAPVGEQEVAVRRKGRPTVDARRRQFLPILSLVVHRNDRRPRGRVSTSGIARVTKNVSNFRVNGVRN